MATLTATAAAASAPAFYNVNGAVTRTVRYAVTAALSAGDVIQMVKVPTGANVSDLRVWTDQFGTSNATIGGVGDGGSAARYVGTASTSSSLAVALILNPSAIGYSYSAEDTIDITIGTVTSASNVGVFVLTVTYSNGNGN